MEGRCDVCRSVGVEICLLSVAAGTHLTTDIFPVTGEGFVSSDCNPAYA